MEKRLISLSIFTTATVLSPCSYCIFSPYMSLTLHKLPTIYYKNVLLPSYVFLTSMNHNHFLTGLACRWDLVTVLSACEYHKNRSSWTHKYVHKVTCTIRAHRCKHQRMRRKQRKVPDRYAKLLFSPAHSFEREKSVSASSTVSQTRMQTEL